MKKGIIGLAIALSLSLIPAYSATPPKAGLSCSMQGITKTYQGKKFSCIKSGKKLVWNKGVTVAKKQPTTTSTPAPSPTSTPNPSPSAIPSTSPTPTQTARTSFTAWMTDLNQEVLVNQANYEFRNWATRTAGNEIIPTYLIDPKLGDVDISWLKNSLNLAIRAFGSDSPSSYTVIVGKDCEWIKTTGNAPCIDSSRNQYFSNSLSSGYFVLQSESDRQKLRPSDLQTAAHEYFHSVQAKLSNGANWQARTTSWFIEGGANYIGISFSDLAGVSSYMQGRDEAVLQRDYQNKKYLPLEKYTYQNFMPPSNYENPYGIGCIATEYIVASVGMQKYLDIYRNLGLGKDFKSAFEAATGLSLADFYTRFEIIRDKVGMPHGQ